MGSSIDVLDELSLWAFHPSDEKQFKSEVYDAYRKACAYVVHESRDQVEERLERAEKANGWALNGRGSTPDPGCGRGPIRIHS